MNSKLGDLKESVTGKFGPRGQTSREPQLQEMCFVYEKCYRKGVITLADCLIKSGTTKCNSFYR